MQFDQAILTAVRVAEEAGNLLARIEDRDTGVFKHDPEFGFHSTVTKADEASMELVINQLTLAYPDARIIVEEESARPCVIRSEEPDLRAGLVFIVDPLDGTTPFSRGRNDWSVSIAVLHSGRHIGGIVYAPEQAAGFLVSGEVGLGLEVMHGGKQHHLSSIPVDRDLKWSEVYFGPDLEHLNEYTVFKNVIARQLKATGIAKSCALAIARIATGQLDAVVEPIHPCWDWGNFPLVLETGGKILFYEPLACKVIKVAEFSKGDVLDFPSISPEAYGTVHRKYGIILGKPWLVDWLWNKLQVTWNQSLDKYFQAHPEEL